MATPPDLLDEAPSGRAGAAQPARSPRRSRAAPAARKRLDPETRSELILDEALRLFAERHHSNVTMRDIADACGINQALIYYYYESKEQLYALALGHAIDQLNVGYEALRLGAGDPRAEIMAWLEMHITIAPLLVRMTKLMADYATSKAGGPEAGKRIEAFYAREQSLIEDCIRRGVASGQFRDVDVARTARTVSLQLDGIFYATGSRADDRVAQDIEDLRQLVASLLDPTPEGAPGNP